MTVRTTYNVTQKIPCLYRCTACGAVNLYKYPISFVQEQGKMVGQMLAGTEAASADKRFQPVNDRRIAETNRRIDQTNAAISSKKWTGLIGGRAICGACGQEQSWSRPKTSKASDALLIAAVVLLTAAGLMLLFGINELFHQRAYGSWPLVAILGVVGGALLLVHHLIDQRNAAGIRSLPYINRPRLYRSPEDIREAIGKYEAEGLRVTASAENAAPGQQ